MEGMGPVHVMLTVTLGGAMTIHGKIRKLLRKAEMMFGNISKLAGGWRATIGDKISLVTSRSHDSHAKAVQKRWHEDHIIGHMIIT